MYCTRRTINNQKPPENSNLFVIKKTTKTFYKIWVRIAHRVPYNMVLTASFLIIVVPIVYSMYRHDLTNDYVLRMQFNESALRSS